MRVRVKRGQTYNATVARKEGEPGPRRQLRQHAAGDELDVTPDTFKKFRHALEAIDIGGELEMLLRDEETDETREDLRLPRDEGGALIVDDLGAPTEARATPPKERAAGKKKRRSSTPAADLEPPAGP